MRGPLFGIRLHCTRIANPQTKQKSFNFIFLFPFFNLFEFMASWSRSPPWIIKNVAFSYGLIKYPYIIDILYSFDWSNWNIFSHRFACALPTKYGIWRGHLKSVRAFDNSHIFVMNRDFSVWHTSVVAHFISRPMNAISLARQLCRILITMSSMNNATIPMRIDAFDYVIQLFIDVTPNRFRTNPKPYGKQFGVLHREYVAQNQIAFRYAFCLRALHAKSNASGDSCNFVLFLFVYSYLLRPLPDWNIIYLFMIRVWRSIQRSPAIQYCEKQLFLETIIQRRKGRAERERERDRKIWMKCLVKLEISHNAKL